MIKGPFRGIGNEFRRLSQYLLFRLWETQYGFNSALEAPFDHATDGIDGEVFSCPHKASRTLDEFQARSFDFVWNFGFLQREPSRIWKMKKISKRYVAAFVPNYLNPGFIVHKLYHKVYGGPCLHPERGDKSLMSIDGLVGVFQQAHLQIKEVGYIDSPPWPDTVITIKQLFGVGEWSVLKIPIDVKPILLLEPIMLPKRIFAHHCYVLGAKK